MTTSTAAAPEAAGGERPGTGPQEEAGGAGVPQPEPDPQSAAVPPVRSTARDLGAILTVVKMSRVLAPLLAPTAARAGQQQYGHELHERLLPVAYYLVVLLCEGEPRPARHWGMTGQLRT